MQNMSFLKVLAVRLLCRLCATVPSAGPGREMKVGARAGPSALFFLSAGKKAQAAEDAFKDFSYLCPWRVALGRPQTTNY